MGRIHVLSEHVANKIAAGEVVERPASVVKELIENSMDAGATRVRVDVEAGGRKLIQVTDNGCGMVRDDALLAFERHATSKLKNDDDLLSIATLGFRGEALPSIAAVSRLRLETREASEASGTVVEIAGGRILTVEEAGLPTGTLDRVRDLFFNTPARQKISQGGVHRTLAYRLAGHALRAGPSRDALGAALGNQRDAGCSAGGQPRRAHLPGIRQRDPRRADPAGGDGHRWSESDCRSLRLGGASRNTRQPPPGDLRLHGFTSKPEIQKLNRNSIFIFVNGRLIRDKVVMHGILEGYRNIIPPTVYPVVLLFLEMPCTEVDVNVHPSKTEVRFRQQSFVHDFVRDAVRSALMAARPVPAFASQIHTAPSARVALTPRPGQCCGGLPGAGEGAGRARSRDWRACGVLRLFADLAAAGAEQCRAAV